MTVAAAVETAEKHVAHEWEAAWSAFETSWNTIRSHVKQYECHEIEVPAVNSTTSLSIAMPSQRPEFPNSVYCLAVLRWFIRTHNEIMLPAAEVLGSAIPTVMSHNLQATECFAYDLDDFKLCIAQHAVQSLEYGQGSEINFVWANIQDWVISNVVGDKPIVYDSVRTFEFMMENMGDSAAEIAGVPQSQIDEKIKAQILVEHRALSKMGKLHQRVHECIGFVKSTRGDEEELLKDYMQMTLGLSDTDIADLRTADGSPGVVMSTIRLKHLRALAELLDERLQGDPLQSLSPKYDAPLTAELTVAIEESATALDLDILLAAWLRFQRKYLVEFQEPYDATAEIKTFLEFSEEPAGQFLYEYEWFDAFPQQLTLLNCGQALHMYRRLHALEA